MSFIGSLILTCIILDQVTKRFFIDLGAVSIGQYLKIKPVWNSGVGFGMFADYSVFYIVCLSFLLVLYIGYLLVAARNTIEKIGLSLIMGGAIGNLIDRVLFYGVFDFISIRNSVMIFPTFNLADIFITTGAGLLLLDFFFGFSRGKKGSKVASFGKKE